MDDDLTEDITDADDNMDADFLLDDSTTVWWDDSDDVFWLAEEAEDFEDDDIIWLDDDIISWNWLVVCSWPPRLEKVRLLPLFYDKKSEGCARFWVLGVLRPHATTLSTSMRLK
jgi:hypothetical protein